MDKLTLDGAQRANTPEETLGRIKPFFPVAGISRVADITGLDRIGIPVALCIRPDSGSLAVDSGKGMTVSGALASAAMEGMERYAAEVEVFDSERGPIRDYREVRFPLLKGARLESGQELNWVAVRDLFTDGEMWVPQRCVGGDIYGREPLSERAFYSTTNGLSAGNTLEEAVCGGIYEVIERDATCIAQSQMNPDRVVTLESIPWPSARGLVKQIEAAGCGVTVFDCLSDIGVPVFMAWIFDKKESGVGVYRGYGCHLSAEIALCRALCEAAQARAVIVAGARDDITQERHLNYLQASERNDWTVWALPQIRDISTAPDGSGKSFREDIGRLMEQLEVAGFARVLLYDFHSALNLGAHVVRMLVPGLEGYLTQWLQVGGRAK